MKKVDLESLKELLLLNEYPILVENISNELFENAVILNNDCDMSLLNGHYEGVDFVAPDWYNILVEKCKNGRSLLIINGINNSEIDEQLKFIEILKYRKISTFDLPKTCSIIVTAYDIKNKPIAEEIYSLVACVCGV